MATATSSAEHSAKIDQISMFLPATARATFSAAAKMLEKADVDLEAFFGQLLTTAEALIQSGLELTTEGAERALESVYDAGFMERIGQINPFLRDGLEIGVQLGLNTLKAMTPADVAKIIGVLLVAWLAPNVFVLNAAAFSDLAMDLLTKLWNLP